MHRSKRDKWKAGIVIVGMLLLLALMVWVPSAVGAYEGTSGLAGPVTVQATSTEDATVAALNKEKLAQEVQQLKNQNEPDSFGWLQTNASIFFSTLVAVIGGLFGLWRWSVDRREERLKERFNNLSSIVTGLGTGEEGPRIGAAVFLGIFLGQGYRQFYKQVFDLAVSNLRLPRTFHLPEDPNTYKTHVIGGTLWVPRTPLPTSLPLTPLSQALIADFQESFPLARGMIMRRNKMRKLLFRVLERILRRFTPKKKLVELKQTIQKQALSFDPQSLDATGINLDNAFLWSADLKQIWMPWAFLRDTDLSEAKLQGAKLWRADLTKVNLWGAHLEEADLGDADLTGADLTGADLTRADLWAKLQGAKLLGAKLTNAKLCRGKYGANLSGADLSGADLSEAHLRYTKLNKARLCLAMLTQPGPQTQGPQVETVESEAELQAVKLQAVKLSKTTLRGPDLIKANLGEVTLFRVILHKAKLHKADLREATLFRADLSEADLSEADLRGAVFTKVELQGADLTGANLSGANLNETNIEEALSLKDTDLRGVKGLKKEPSAICKAKGAIID